MGKNKETKYRALDSDDVDLDPVSTPVKPRRSIVCVVIWLELANLVAFVFFYTLWSTLHKHYQWGYDGMPLKYSMSQTFIVDKNDLRFVKSTPEADKYWMNITHDRHNGLVSLPTAWAEKYDLKPSAQKTKNGESVFQVDMFHQLHCLERIRGEIISAKYLYQLNPNRTEDDPATKHSLHCVDYLRQAIMCAGDMTLVSTGTDLEFDHGPARQCRDFDAVSKWVMENQWDYETFLNG